MKIVGAYIGYFLDEIRLGFIGDHYVGKTAFLHVYTEKKDPDTYEYHREVYEDHRLESKVHGITFPIVAVDIMGAYCIQILRMMYNPRITCFILCYAIDDMMSFMNVFYWLEELRKLECAIPILLVATKIDLRYTGTKGYITREQGLELQQRYRAASFMECSIYSKESLEAVIQEGTRLSVIALREAYKQWEKAAKWPGIMDRIGSASTDIIDRMEDTGADIINRIGAVRTAMAKKISSTGTDLMDMMSDAAYDIMEIIRQKPMYEYKKFPSSDSVDSDHDSFSLHYWPVYSKNSQKCVQRIQ